MAYRPSLRAALAAALIFPGLCSCAPSPNDVIVAASTADTYAATMVGRIDSAESARSLVAATPGVIDQVAVQRGDTVRRGQFLFSVDCRPMITAVAVRQAEAAQADALADTIDAGARSEDIARAEASQQQEQSAAADAQDQLDRAAALVDRGFVSDREIMARRNALASAQAAVASAAAEVARLRHGARPSERAEARWRANAASASIAVTSSAAVRVDPLSRRGALAS